MASAHHLAKVFLLAVTTGPNGQPFASLDIPRARLTALVTGQFESIETSDGLVQISSQNGDTAYGFAPARNLDRADLASIAARVLAQLDTCTTVAQARAKYLAPRARSSRPDFTGLCP